MENRQVGHGECGMWSTAGRGLNLVTVVSEGRLGRWHLSDGLREVRDINI